MAFRGAHPIELEQPDRFAGREVAPFTVGGAELERGNDFTVALQLLARHRPGLAMVAATDRAWLPTLSKGFIESRFGEAIKFSCGLDKLTMLCTPGRHRTQLAS
jgi:hypothetical protein